LAVWKLDAGAIGGVLPVAGMSTASAKSKAVARMCKEFRFSTLPDQAHKAISQGRR
jgi:hypothetical protein